DKTGTLTKGEHAVVGVAAVGDRTEAEVLSLAAGVEADSEHPLARAVVAAAPRPARASGFRSLPGRGVRASVDGVPYAVGGPALLRELDVEPPTTLQATTGQWAAAGAAVLYLVRLGEGRSKVLGALALEDEVRPEAPEAVDALRRMGVGTIGMITGDSRAVAEAVAGKIGRA